jgi:GIY-YIG catalytic domain-containing protein
MEARFLETKSVTMKKLEEVQPYVSKMDDLFKDLYSRFDKSDFVSKDKLPSKGGIYVFYESEKALYVGRTDNVKQRIQLHTRPSSGSESATFAFNLAKAEHGVKNEIKETRKELMKNEEFKKVFITHKSNVSNFRLKFIQIENDVLQTMFEPYLAIKLNTYPNNNTFENH